MYPSVLPNTDTAADGAADFGPNTRDNEDAIVHANSRTDHDVAPTHRRADIDSIADAEPDTDSGQNASESRTGSRRALRINRDDWFCRLDLASLPELTSVWFRAESGRRVAREATS
jgi:hypothetical protein